MFALLYLNERIYNIIRVQTLLKHFFKPNSIIYASQTGNYALTDIIQCQLNKKCEQAEYFPIMCRYFCCYYCCVTTIG